MFDVAAGIYDDFWDRVQAGQWEPTLFDVLNRWIDPETTFIDVGAWIGAVSLYVAPRARHVFALEPDLVAFSALEQNVRISGSSNLTLLPIALARSTGEAQMCAPMGRAGDSRSTLHPVDRGGGWSVKTVGVLDLLREHSIPDSLFIKMDVEGYEYELLPRLIADLRERRFTLHVALHPYWRGADIRGRLTRLRKRLRMGADNLRLVQSVRGVRFHNPWGRQQRKMNAAAGAALFGIRRRGSVLTIRSESR